MMTLWSGSSTWATPACAGAEHWGHDQQTPGV